MASFCSCAENLNKDEFKDGGWICLDISRQDGFQAGEEEAAVTEKSVHHTIIEESPVPPWENGKCPKGEIAP